jgi:hypothetical protein
VEHRHPGTLPWDAGPSYCCCPPSVDEAALDLNLRPESPAFTMPGFEAIPFDEIGIEP